MLNHFRIIRITDGFPVGTIEAKSARAAILKAHKAFGWSAHHKAFPCTLEESKDINSGRAAAQWCENMRMARVNLRMAIAAGLR